MTEAVQRLNAALEGRYRIERELGVGGMATVYLAEDLKHDRKVALKVLKPELAAVLGADRFVVEIKTTASLQHPHILPLFDSGTADEFLFYVMPYIDGETLRDRLNRETQLGIDDAVKIATEVADALDYAHRSGVIHRDIKPENILMHDGRPMVADFGIALAVSAAAGGRMTETGLSLGTPFYMSPEQATADKEISARSDVYSLASVLYETLTGEPPHMGNSAQQIIMKIIADTPRPVTQLRKSVPSNVAAAVAKALEKLPADRFTSAKEFADALVNPAFTIVGAAIGSNAASQSGVSRRAFAGISGLALLATVAALWGWLRPGPAPAAVLRYEDVALSEGILNVGEGQGNGLAVSPDGRLIAYRGGVPGSPQIFIRTRDALTGRPLPGSERSTAPFFSPDGRKIGFCEETARGGCSWKTMLAEGGPATVVTDDGAYAGATWGPDGMIYVSDENGLTRYPEAGGPGTAFTTVNTAAGEVAHFSTAALPNGKGVLLIVLGSGSAQLAVADADGTHRLLGLSAVSARYARTGHVAFVTPEGTLEVAPFDQDRLEITGDPRVVAEDVRMRGPFTDMDLSRTGTLVYSASTNARAPDQVVWLDRDGTERSGEPWLADFGDLALSPDGTGLVVSIRETGITELWVRRGEDGPLSRLSYAGDGTSSEPAWTPDSRSVAWILESDGTTAVWMRRADGSAPAETLFTWNRRLGGLMWAPDTTLLFSSPGSSEDDIFAFQPGTDSVPRPVLAERFDQIQPAMSPDGRWLAYESDESGVSEVYLRPFPDVNSARIKVSSEGGRTPGWSGSGRELQFVRSSLQGPAEMRAVEFSPGTPPSVGDERVLFSQPAGISYWGATPDGDRFVIVRTAQGEAESNHVIVVENWFEELKTLLQR